MLLTSTIRHTPGLSVMDGSFSLIPGLSFIYKRLVSGPGEILEVALPLPDYILSSVALNPHLVHHFPLLSCLTVRHNEANQKSSLCCPQHTITDLVI